MLAVFDGLQSVQNGLTEPLRAFPVTL